MTHIMPAGTPFMDRIHFEPMSGCWLWGSSVDGKGYGQYWDKTIFKKVRAHRYSYELHKGKIPEGCELDHKCRNRECVNPDHLEPVSHRENTLRGIAPSAVNSKKTHCPSGHPYESASIDGLSRKCKECDRITKEKIRRAKGIQTLGERRSSKKTCKYGHPWTPDNIDEYTVNGRTKKACSTCRRLRLNRIYHKNKAMKNGDAQ